MQAAGAAAVFARRTPRFANSSIAHVLRVDRPGHGRVVGAGDDGAGVLEESQLVAFDFYAQQVLVAGNDLGDAFQPGGKLVERNARAGMARVARSCGRKAPLCGSTSGRRARDTPRAGRSGNRPAPAARACRFAGTSAQSRDRRSCRLRRGRRAIARRDRRSRVYRRDRRSRLCGRDQRPRLCFGPEIDDRQAARNRIAVAAENLHASAASIDAIRPTMAPKIPAVSHVGTLPGAGHSGIRQPRQGVSPGRIVIDWPSAPTQPP